MSRIDPSSPQRRAAEAASSAEPDLAAAVAAWLCREEGEEFARSEVDVSTETASEARMAEVLVTEATLRRVFRRLPEPAVPASFTHAVMARVAAQPDAERVWLRRLERWVGPAFLVAAGLFLLVLPPLLSAWWGDAGLGVHSIGTAAHGLVALAADWARAALAFWAWVAGLLGTLLRAFASVPGLMMLTTCALLGLGTWSLVGGQIAARVSSRSNLSKGPFLRGA